ncbi:MAG: 4-hydroxy-3-methylbut-2-enyl diphosphate reductase, partial [Oscillospiraceae bacterium]|nr:4-hydroxy-3-methylbut-2-enyl diphosphate reductase [Oscillospiraceae bacterium]
MRANNKKLKVILTKSAGFCYGVSRAVSMCEEAAEVFENCVTLGPIIHNEHVTRDLERKGIRIVSSVKDIQPGSTVIIRSHGAARDEYEALASLNVNIIDATCPDVKKIHNIAHSQSHEGRLMLIIGQRYHPEIKAISSWCDKYIIFESPEELREWLNIKNNTDIAVSIVFQTTNTESVLKTCTEIIKKECTNHRIFDTICNATLKRRQDAVRISKISDIVVVVGDKNSSNSLKLADVCRQYCKRVIFTQSADDIKTDDFRSVDVVGITAGASTPAFIIKEVTLKMKEEVNMDGILVEQESIEALPEPEEVNITETEEAAVSESVVVDAEAEAEAEVEVETEAEVKVEAEVEAADAKQVAESVVVSGDAEQTTDNETAPDAKQDDTGADVSDDAEQIAALDDSEDEIVDDQSDDTE